MAEKAFGWRIYGLGIIALGLLSLAWGDFQSGQTVPKAFPARTELAYAVAIFLFTAGAGIEWRKTTAWAAAAITRKTKAIAVAVSQSSGTVRIFQNGEVVLHIEPLARPMIWGHFHMEAQEEDGVPRPVESERSVS